MDDAEKAQQIADYFRQRAEKESEGKWQMPTAEQIEQAQNRLAAGEPRRAVCGPHAPFYLFETDGARLIGRWNPHPNFVVERVELLCERNQWGQPLTVGPFPRVTVRNVGLADRYSLSVIYNLMLRFAPRALPAGWRRRLNENDRNDLR